MAPMCAVTAVTVAICSVLDTQYDPIWQQVRSMFVV